MEKTSRCIRSKTQLYIYASPLLLIVNRRVSSEQKDVRPYAFNASSREADHARENRYKLSDTIKLYSSGLFFACDIVPYSCAASASGISLGEFIAVRPVQEIPRSRGVSRVLCWTLNRFAQLGIRNDTDSSLSFLRQSAASKEPTREPLTARGK